MKKISLLLPLAIIFCCRQTTAQRILTDGEITYKVKVDIPTGNQQMADLFRESTYTLYIKGKLRRTDMNLGIFSQTLLTDAGKGTAVMLMQNANNKYLIRLSKDDLQQQRARYEGITFRDTTGSKKIAGYTCKKAIARLKDGTTFPVYYTTSLMPDATSNMDKMFSSLKGIPLEYEITRQGLKMTMTATHVDLNPVPASTFDIPASGYREVTQDELRKMSEKRQQ